MAVIREAVELTVAEGSARLLLARPQGDPVPETDDAHGEGVVDLRQKRVWIDGYRSTTSAEAAGLRQLTRPRLTVHLFSRLLTRARPRDRYFDATARYKRKRNGSWSEGMPLLWSPGPSVPERSLETEHPLWLFKPLAKLSSEPGVPEDQETVRGVETTRYSIALTSAEVSPPTWEELAHPDAPEDPPPDRWWRPGPHPQPRSSIPAFVWLDDQRRIRRMSYQLLTYHPFVADGQLKSIPPDWRTTEFWDFGVEIHRQPPSEALGVGVGVAGREAG